jgi:hypothetical protein
VLAASVFALVGGGIVMTTGRAQQVMVVGTGLITVAMGLVYNLDIGSPTSKWVDYQPFVGIVMSLAIMHGLSIVQANVSVEGISTVTATYCVRIVLNPENVIRSRADPILRTVFQTLGGAFSTSSGQSAFFNRLLHELPKAAPTVNPGLVIRTGASELHKIFPPEVLPGVLQAYLSGTRVAFVVAVGFAGAAFISAWFIPWKKLPTHAPGEVPVMAV